ncbi:hypothetical protein [Nitrospira sp. Ecomares 2.1]
MGLATLTETKVARLPGRIPASISQQRVGVMRKKFKTIDNSGAENQPGGWPDRYSPKNAF